MTKNLIRAEILVNDDVETNLYLGTEDMFEDVRMIMRFAKICKVVKVDLMTLEEVLVSNDFEHSYKIEMVFLALHKDFSRQVTKVEVMESILKLEGYL